MKIAAVGDISVDHYINLNLKKPGGIAFNFAVGAMQKHEASLFSAIGSDASGKKLKKLVKHLEINISHVASLQGKTAKQKIVLQHGERKFVGYTAGVLKHWKPQTKDLEFLSKQDAIFVPLSDGMKHIFESVAFLKTDAIKIADFSQDSEYADFEKENNTISQYCQYFDIVFVGATEDQKPLLLKLSKKYPNKVFVLTLGSKGSIGYQNGTPYIHQIEKKKIIVDTTGAGDAFQACFINNYFLTKDISLSLKKATSSAAEVIQYVGSTKYSL